MRPVFFSKKVSSKRSSKSTTDVIRRAACASFEQLEDRTLFALAIAPYDPSTPISTLTNALFKGSTGITVTNASFVGGNGQAGTYTGFNVTDGTHSLSLGNGIILTSGLAVNALGPNNSSGVSKSWGTAGDTDLNSLIGTNNDANAYTVNFTATPATKSVSFSFVFGSDEFPEFVGEFNDAFAAYLDGKQISFDSKNNPITVNNNFFTLNNTNPSDTTTTATQGKTVVNFNLQYDGLTPVLSTKGQLDTTKTNHTLKFVVADAGDTALDSGVFISTLAGDDSTGTGTGQPPTAKAGGPYTVAVGGTVKLDGTKSSDPNQTSSSLIYSWDLDGDGIFGETGSAAGNGDETSSTPTFKAGTLTSGTVKTVTLKVTDNTGLSSTSTATVTVTGGTTQVVANAGGPYTINEGSSLVLNGSKSTAPAGSTFSWDVNGDGVYGDATGQNPTMTWTQLKSIGIIDGNSTSVYTAKVKITSNGAATISAGTTVTVKNVAPTANAGADKAITLGSTANLVGAFTDPGDADKQTFLWTITDASGVVVATSTSQNFGFKPTKAGTFNAKLKVTDDDGGSSTDSAIITVNSISTGPTIASFILVDADTDKDILTLTDGMTLDLSKLPRRLNVRATTGGSVGSVQIGIDGKNHIEKAAPWALFDDNGGDFAQGTFADGNHTISAMAFTGLNGTGSAGTLKSIGIKVINQPPTAPVTVTSIILVNEDTKQDIKVLKDFDSLDLGKLPKNLGFRVTTSGTAGSVTYTADAKINANPTSIFNSTKSGYHTLTALPFTGANGTGTLGASLQLRLFIIPAIV